MGKRRYNDYIRLTQGYLRDLVYHRGEMDIIISRINELKAELADVSTRIVGYEEKQGGCGELTQVEAEASRRIEEERELDQAENDLKRLKYHIFRVEQALSTLGDDDRRAVELFYFERRKYNDMAIILHWSPRTCRRRVNETTAVIAFMLFGDKSKEQLRFVC